MTLLDDRPDAIDRLIRPGNTYVLTLDWEDSLAGRTFASTLGGTALEVVVVDDDTMTVTASADITGDLEVGVAVDWTLTETTGADDQVVLVGTWTPDDGPRAGTSSTVTVAAGGSTVTVQVPGAGAVTALAARVTTAEGDIDDIEAADVAHAASTTAHGNPAAALAAHAALTNAHGDPLGALADHEGDTTAHGNPAAALAAHAALTNAHGDPLSALATHAALPLAGAGAHGVIEHNWTRDGWAPFTRVVATAAAGQSLTLSVVNGRGRATASASSADNHREWFLHPATNWRRARLTATWWGPSTWTPSNRPQMGFVFGAQQLSPNRWVALVCWYNIFQATDPSGLIVNGWDVDGTNVTLGNGNGAGSLANVNRQAVVIRAEHVAFIGDLSVMRVAPPWAAIIGAGTPITVSGMEDSDYDLTGTVAGAAPGDINVTASLPSAPAAPVDRIAGGTMVPTAPWNATPYCVSAERTGPATLRVTQWAYGSGDRPDPGDPRSTSVTVTQGSMGAFPTDAPGLHGILVGHALSNSYAEWGDITFEQR